MSLITAGHHRRYAVCLIAILAGLTGWWFNSKLSTTEGTGDSSVLPNLPPISSSRFLNVSAEVSYVGRSTCATCHPDEHLSYSQTAHSKALSETDLANEPPDGMFEHAPSGRKYRVYRDGSQLRHRESIRTRNGKEIVLADFAVRYTIGSGRFSRSYLVETDGFLVESPITWYTSRPGWAISPGYDQYNSGFERPVEIRCLNCHVGRAEPIDGSPHRIRIHTQAIDCERCHGPGALHVQHWDSDSADTGDFDLTIVNPRRLDRERNEAICAQCHQHVAATVDIRGRKLSDFRPGLRLKDFSIHYGLETPSKSMTVVGHFEQMHLSRCYNESDTLTCTTCHNPHMKRNPAEALSFYRSKCLSCHSEQSCGLSQQERISKSAEDNCVACHMPQSPTEIPHFAFTHHRIGLHDIDQPPVDKGIASLVPLVDLSHLPRIEQDRLLGLAYLQLSDTPGHTQHVESHHNRARAILEDVRRRGLRDPELDAALARLSWGQDPQRTIELAESVLRSEDLTPDTRATALFTLGSSYFLLDDTKRAAAPLQRLVRVRRYADAWHMLSTCQYRTGDIAVALEAAHKAAKISPHRPDFHETIARLHRQIGNVELSAKHSALAEELHRHHRRLAE